MRRRLTAGLVAALAVPAFLTAGCAQTVGGTAMKAGTGSSRGENSADKYPNLLKECDVLTSDVLAKTVGADPLDIQSTFVGAVCRWQALNPAGLIDITRFWYEQGSLDNEKKVAAALNYQVETKNIAGVPSILMHSGDACGVASDAGGVVGWWVNPQAPGIDACAQAIKLMELTLATNS